MCTPQNLNYNIVLCGFMGCGKTTVGKNLSQKIDFNFIDTDSYVEGEIGCTINEIFNIYGENYFRNLEKNCIKTVSKRHRTVISTGGGTVLDDQNLVCLRQNGKIFYLDVPLEVIISRLGTDSTRPLIKNKNAIKKLFTERRTKYLECADYIINANQCVNKISDDIICRINCSGTT